MSSPGPRKQKAARPVRVFLFDLLPAVPYYTGYLTAALKNMTNVEVTLGSATYTHDESYYGRMGLKNAPGFIDFAYRVHTTPVRQVLKTLECLLNMAVLSVRFRKSPPDVIHVQFTPLAEHRIPVELWFLKAAHRRGIRLVYTVHNVLPHDASRQVVATYRKLYQLMDQFICHDDHAKARLVDEFGVDAARIAVIPHGPLFGPEEEKVDKNPGNDGRFSNRCVVLWQGIIRPYKGLSFLLKAWKAARDAGLQADLWIVGTGDTHMLRQIEQDVASLKLESSVHCDLRFVPIEELASYYETADVIVYPYSEITTSGALMTGIGYGRAIIASRLPAFEQILYDQTNALLAPYGDVDAWASALLRLASDPGLRVRLARELHATRSLTPSWRDIASDTCRVYERLVPAA